MHLYVAFEGPIGAGKTTWSQILADRLQHELYLEEFEDNAFLSDFYLDRERWALPMQLWFLAARHRQLARLGQRHAVVADYSYLKDRVFASMLLAHRDLRLYESLREGLATSAPVPTLVVYLDAATDVLLRRIRARGRGFEQGITAGYLDELRRHYLERLDGYAPHLQIDTTHLRLDDPAQVDAVVQLITRQLQ